MIMISVLTNINNDFFSFVIVGQPKLKLEFYLMIVSCWNVYIFCVAEGNIYNIQIHYSSLWHIFQIILNENF